MADERGATLIGGTEAALKTIHEELVAFRLDAHGRLSRLETGFEQVDKRIGETNAVVGDTRKEVRQLLYVVLGTWVTLMLTVISLSVTILSRLK